MGQTDTNELALLKSLRADTGAYTSSLVDDLVENERNLSGYCNTSFILASTHHAFYSDFFR